MNVSITQYQTENLHEYDAGVDEEDEEEEVRDAVEIVLKDSSKGLGIKICGGCSIDGQEVHGIFIRRTLPGGLADIDGNLQQGDQILEVNEESLEGVTNERAVSILRNASASHQVRMIVSRDEQAKLEFQEILQRKSCYSNPTSPTPTESQSKHTSRATTPSGYGTDSMAKSPVSTDMGNEPVPSNEKPSSPRLKEHRTSCSNTRSMGDSGMSTRVVNGHPAHREDSVPQQTMHAFARHLNPSMASTPRTSGSSNDASLGTRLSNGLSPLYAVEEPSSIQDNPFISANGPQNSLFHSQGSYDSLSHNHKTSQFRMFSLDSNVQLKIEKLELALRYLGLEPTAKQQAALRSQLNINDSGTVSYGDFVSVAKVVFKSELESLDLNSSGTLFNASDLKDIIEPPPFNHEMSKNFDAVGDCAGDEIGLQQDPSELRQEIKRLRALLQEKETECIRAEEELSQFKTKAQAAIDEIGTLKTKVQLAVQAQRAARNMEQDYEVVVQFLEREIAKLKSAPVKGNNSETSTSMQQKMAVLSCQLMKAEAGKKTYEVTTEKLLQFVEHVHEVMTGQGSSLRTKSEGEVARGNRPPGYLGKHKTQNPKTLASEAKEVVQAVRSIIELEPLPYGWEEVHTTDGMKYYMDHVNQVTSWTHPKSGVQHLARVRESKDNVKPNTQPKSVD